MSLAMVTIFPRLLEIRFVRKDTPKGFRKREVTPNQSAKPPTEAAKDTWKRAAAATLLS